MKYIYLIFILLGTSKLFGFEIKSVDLTKEGIEKENLPYRIAKDGKTIYKDIGKVVKSLDNQTIKSLKSQPIKPMRVRVIYPVDSNMSDKKSFTQKKINIDTKAKEDISDVFSNLNNKDKSKSEEISDKNNKIKLDENNIKSNPINLEN